MPLALTPPAAFTLSESNVTAPAVTMGTSVAAGGSANSYNTTWTELIASTSFDAYAIEVFFTDVAENTFARGLLVNIGVGAAASETTIIPDLNAGGSVVTLAGQPPGHRYWFPLYIPSGSRISATASATLASDTVRVTVRLYGGPTKPVWAGHQVTAYGVTSASSQGTSVTYGQTNAEGSWTQITASTGAHCYYLAAGVGIDADTTTNSTMSFLDVGVGAATETLILETCGGYIHGNSSEAIQHEELGGFVDIPSGSRLVARISNAQTNSGTHDVILYGVS